MGCNSSRPNSNPAEGKLAACEESLHFSSLKATQHLYALGRFSQESPYLNEAAFRSAADKMRIQVLNSPENNKIEAFYRGLKNEQGMIFVRDLMLLGVLLGSGDASEKAQVLFEIYDDSYLGVLTRQHLSNMYAEMLDLCVDKVRPLIDAHPSDKSEIDAYLHRLKEARSEGERSFLELVAGSKAQVKTDEFIQSFTQSAASDLLSSSGFRHHLYTHLPSKPA